MRFWSVCCRGDDHTNRKDDGPTGRSQDYSGARTLSTDISNKNLSIVRYVYRNANLDQSHETMLFTRFYQFVEKMLFFRSLDFDQYMGYQMGSDNICAGILEKGSLADFERFLHDAEVDCSLKGITHEKHRDIAMCFADRDILFYEVASTGTKSLALFYHWLLRMREDASFVYIDEFDAFYHWKLAKEVVSMVKQMDSQILLLNHNTRLLNNDILRPDCNFELKDNTLKPLSLRTEKGLREGHDIEKLYRANMFHG